ncbi:MAG: phosphoribosyltransferase family protein [Oscillospiraceae bacterium]|jgi:adenine phosphoribosyltransferase|nr:adenine phosphoribosyltransferase [Oscillospiraceae bacterium]MDY4192145.1 phosphoribosyltransferase family protein [Oscillospiraceae bacterium]
MQDTYELSVAGLKRDLPICPINDKVSIAAFIMFSDVELTIACAAELGRIVPEHDVLLTAESKGIPLAYEMSRQSGKKYILARKSAKLYMYNPVAVDVKSITTANLQTLYLDAHDMDYLKGKRVLVVDDVISTGESLNAMEELVRKAGGNVVGRAAVLAEGDAARRDDILFLAPLPVFVKE